MRTSRLAAAGAAVAAVTAAAAAGTHVAPAPFRDFGEPSGAPTDMVPLGADLPGPVRRWLHGVYGDLLPVHSSVVITGRARMNPFGVWLPARFRFIHDAGRGYRHYIEACLFGRPVLAVNERYLDGEALMEVPLVGSQRGPEVDQAANIGMWAELAAAAPAVLATDPRVRWAPVDDHTATLSVPLGRGRDSLTVRFDPPTGRLRWVEAWRYRAAGDASKTLWIAAVEPGATVGRYSLPAVGTATWADQAQPWAKFTTEDLRTDVDVAAAIRGRGD